MSLQRRRVGLARKYGTGPRKRSRAVQKSAEVIVPSRTYYCGREGPNDEVGEEPSFDSVRGTVPTGIDRIGVKREASPGEVRVVRMTLTTFVEPPGAAPHARWCGEGGQQWPPLPDLFHEHRAYSLHVTFFCLRDTRQIGLMNVIQASILSIFG